VAEMTVDLEAISEHLTFEDMEILEELSGVPIGDFPVFGGGGKVTAKMLKALVYISVRHTNPDVTVEDVAKMKISTLGDSPLDEDSPSESGTLPIGESAKAERDE
jgi:hypothetical protein